MPTDNYLIAASAVALLHIAVILLDIFGALTVVSGRLSVGCLPRWQKLYFAITATKSVSSLTMGTCPLTSMEKFLLSQSVTLSAYRESFVEHYFPFISINFDLALTLFLMLSGCIGVLQVAIHQVASLPCFAQSKNSCSQQIKLE